MGLQSSLELQPRTPLTARQHYEIGRNGVRICKNATRKVANMTRIYTNMYEQRRTYHDNVRIQEECTGTDTNILE